jgi:hypothetical protein
MDKQSRSRALWKSRALGLGDFAGGFFEGFVEEEKAN